MSEMESEGEDIRFSREERMAIRNAVAHWAQGRPPWEPVLCFLSGVTVTARELARIERSWTPRYRTLYRLVARQRAARVDRHILSLFAAEMEQTRTSLEQLLATFRTEPPMVAGAAATEIE
jgi:hypothetical protein